MHSGPEIHEYLTPWAPSLLAVTPGLDWCIPHSDQSERSVRAPSWTTGPAMWTGTVRPCAALLCCSVSPFARILTLKGASVCSPCPPVRPSIGEEVCQQLSQYLDVSSTVAAGPPSAGPCLPTMPVHTCAPRDTLPSLLSHVLTLPSHPCAGRVPVPGSRHRAAPPPALRRQVRKPAGKAPPSQRGTWARAVPRTWEQ